MKPPSLLTVSVLLLSFGFVAAVVVPDASADYVILKSGGRVEGEVIEESEERVTVRVEGLGEIRFERADVEKVEYSEIRRLPTNTPPPPTATPIPTETQRPRFLEPAYSIPPTATNTPVFVPGQVSRRPTATPLTQVAQPERPPQPEPGTLRPAPEPPDQGEQTPEEFPFEDLYGDYRGEETPGGFSWDPREVDEEALFKQVETFVKGFIVGVIIFSLLFYLYLSLCRHVIAVKTDTPNAWWAWIPVLRDMLLLRVGGNPAWWAMFINLGFVVWFTCEMMLLLETSSGLSDGSGSFGMRIVYLLGFLLWGCFSYMMWKDVCIARGKAKSTAYLMHLHVVFAVATAYCCCFFPFVAVGMLCYYVVCPPFIAFYK